MLIDWFTVGAQVINFLILVWLLKRYLYKPVLDAIDTREAGIAKTVADAAAAKSTAQDERDAFAQKNKAIEDSKAALLASATVEANTERDRLLAEARKVADALRQRQTTDLSNDLTRISGEITTLVRTEVFEVARKVLHDLASSSLEERIVAAFIERVRGIDSPIKARIVSALARASATGVVRSAFPIADAQKAAIGAVVNEEFASKVALSFELVPSIVCGVEFVADGEKLTWSVDDYLGTFSEKAAGLLAHESAPAPAPVAAQAPAQKDAQPATGASVPMTA